MRALNRRLTYEEISRRSKWARSSAWFNNLVNRDVGPNYWGVNPPGPDTWDGIAELLNVTADDVRQMVAHEWFGVKQEGTSERVAALATRLDKLDDEDANFIDSLLTRLTTDYSG